MEIVPYYIDFKSFAFKHSSDFFVPCRSSYRNREPEPEHHDKLEFVIDFNGFLPGLHFDIFESFIDKN